MYLDNAASTQVSNEVENKIYEVLSIFGNPSSQHDEGFKAKNVINEATKIIANKLNCSDKNIYYTSGATMSNNLAIQGFIRKNPNCKVLYSAIEHNDIIMMAKYFDSIFIEIPVKNDGKVDFCVLSSELAKYSHLPVLVVIQFANSEIGTIQRIDLISKMVHEYHNSYLYVDATQYLPYYKCNVTKIGIDMLGMSGQKIKCIKGTGLLYVKDSNLLSPIIFGEQGLIGGTENTLGIACLGEAFKNLNYNVNNLSQKRDYFINKLNKKLVGSNIDRLPNNISVLFPDVSSEEFVELLNEFGICASAGSACSSGSLEPSHVLKALGYSDDEANSCIRFTINEDITYDEIDKAINIINNIYKMQGV